MKMMHCMRDGVVALTVVCMAAGMAWATEKTLKIGFNVALTGSQAQVGLSCKKAAELRLKEINAEGGVRIGDKRYPLEFIYEDNASSEEAAATVVTKLVTKDNVLALIGPNPSGLALPAGAAANENSTPMISPWSTNDKLTKDRPWVFRAPFLDSFQAIVTAKFASEAFFPSKKVAILFDGETDYCKSLAEGFRAEWSKRQGADSIVAYEPHKKGEKDFKAYLEKILQAKPDFIFLPDYGEDVVAIVKQARAMGWKSYVLGVDGWIFGNLAECGEDCAGEYFCTHYAARGAKGTTKKFIQKFRARYSNETPDDVAALTWDSINILVKAIQDVGKVHGKVQDERTAIREAMAQMDIFPGITGNMKFNEQGDPIKCAVMARINSDGNYTFFKNVCPDK